MRIMGCVFPYDPQILAVVEAVPQNIPQVLAAMNAIAALTADGDGLKWFNWLYLEVTEAVEQRVGGGGFANAAWLAELDVQFASLYFAALRDSLSGRAAPGCWTALFEHRSEVGIARIQFALAGINAHINHDLPLAVNATCDATGTSPVHGSAVYNDYTSVNGTLDGLVELAKKTLMIRLLGDPLPPVSHLEDTIAAWSVTAARETAWTNAEVLWNLRAMPPLYSRCMDGIDGLTAVAGKTLLVPVPIVAAAGA
jgi:Family of unknown function (DUF5995)